MVEREIYQAMCNDQNKFVGFVMAKSFKTLERRIKLRTNCKPYKEPFGLSKHSVMKKKAIRRHGKIT